MDIKLNLYRNMFVLEDIQGSFSHLPAPQFRDLGRTVSEVVDSIKKYIPPGKISLTITNNNVKIISPGDSSGVRPGDYSEGWSIEQGIYWQILNNLKKSRPNLTAL